MQPILNVSLYQCVPQPLDVAGNLRRLDDAATQAAAQGADVLVCPEMFVTGYAIGATAVQQLAQPADGGYAQAVAAITRQHGLAIVYGYPEHNPAGQPFNAAQWISATGERLLNYRKTHLFAELDRAQFAAGAPSSALLLCQGWRIGLLICYDVEFPENTRRLAAAGADAVLVPTANMLEYDFVAQSMVPVRAYENQMFVAYANYVGTEGDVQYGGLSIVAGPDGSTLMQAGRTPTVTFTSLQQRDLQAARKRLTHVADLTPRA